MFNRPMLFVGGLVAAVVVPYLLLDDHLANAARSQWNRLAGRVERKENELPSEPRTPAASRPQPLVVSTTTIEQAFRFDITPQWVATRWPRVSTLVGDPKQLGMRVAWVSGTQPDDVAGSLTYHFDEHHQLQRITFTGLTADPRRLLATVVTPNGLVSQPTTNAARYIAGDPQRPTSAVNVRHVPVMVTDAPARAEISVDLRRADAIVPSSGKARPSEEKILPSGYRRW